MRHTILALALVSGCAARASAIPIPVVDVGKGTQVATTPAARCNVLDPSLATLEEPVRVTAWTSHSTPEAKRFGEALAAFLGRVARASNGKLVVRIVEPVTEEEKAIAHGFELVDGRLGGADDDDAPRGLMGIRIELGGEHETLPFLSSRDPDGVAYLFGAKLHELIARTQNVSRVVGVVTGHGEHALDEPNLLPPNLGNASMASTLAKVRRTVKLHPMVAAGSTPLDGLIVTQPATAWTEADLRALDARVLTGLPTAIIASAVNLRPSDETMHASLDRHGLERLLAHYGVDLHDDLVLDPASAFQVVAAVGDEVRPLVFPQLPLVRHDALAAKELPFFRLEQLSFPLASSLALVPARQPDAMLRPLARTSAHGASSHELDLGPAHRWAEPTAPAAQILAASIEGTLTSAFDAHRRGERPSRVLVIASGMFLENPFAVSGRPPSPLPSFSSSEGDELLLSLAPPYAQTTMTSTILALVSIIDWMTVSPALAACTGERL